VTARAYHAQTRPAGRQRAPQRRLLCALALVPAIVSATVVLDSPAQAQPDTGKSIERVKNKIETLHHQAESTTEDYLEVKETLSSTRIRAKASRERVRQQRHQITITRENLGRLAADMYQQGELSTLAVALGNDPDQMLARAGLASTVAERQQVLSQRLHEQETKLEADAAAVTSQQKQISSQEAKLGRLKRKIKGQISEANGELSRLKSVQRAELLRASRSHPRKAPTGSLRDAPISGSGTSVSCGGAGIVAPSERVADVLRFACAQLGDPYVWAGSGPNSWDCSGFTRGAWAAGGVSLPHSSRLQIGYGQRVSRDSLLPGDLVFFFSPISHVGIYIGNGMMIHAPNSGDVVKIAPVLGGFVGAVRL
jgi:cell wall-associated NlpC family hydrolase